MHNTTQPRKNGKGFKIKLGPAPQRGNIFPIAMPIDMAAMADKRKQRREMKDRNRARKWKED